MCLSPNPSLFSGCVLIDLSSRFFYIITAFTLIIGGGLGMRKHRMNKRGGPRISIVRWLLALPFIIAYYILIDTVKVCLDLYLSRKKVKQPEVQIRTKQWRTFRKWTSVNTADILDMPNPVAILWKKLMQIRMQRRALTRLSPALIRALQDERVASGIAGQLHHVELVSLSLACRAVREALYLHGRREKLRECTCLPVTSYIIYSERVWIKKDDAVVENPGIAKGETSECWGCGIRVCRVRDTFVPHSLINLIYNRNTNKSNHRPAQQPAKSEVHPHPTTWPCAGHSATNASRRD